MMDIYKKDGFTLVEIAIVIVVVGILLTGVLKGSEMITHTKIAGTITDIKTFEGSLSTFKLKYVDLPGDIQQTNTRLGLNCTAAPCTTGGNRNGRIDGNPNAAPTLASEGTTAFAHLAAANLITGVDINGNNHGFSNALPKSKLGGGYWLSSTSNGLLSPAFGARRAAGGHYLVFSKQLENVDFTDIKQGIRAKYVAEMDRKLDDGFPLSGDVWAGGAACLDGTNYNEDRQRSSCTIFAKVM